MISESTGVTEISWGKIKSGHISDKWEIETYYPWVYSFRVMVGTKFYYHGKSLWIDSQWRDKGHS